MTPASKIRELDFSDLYLGHPHLGDRFSDVPGAKANPLPASASLLADLDRLGTTCREVLKTAPSTTGFTVCYDGISYRVSVMRTAAGTAFVLRKIASTIHSLAELGVPQAYIPSLMTRDLSGLLIVSGGIKAGKTNTACALVKDRLAVYGGVAITGEDLIELPLEGSYGTGICFQTATPRDKRDFADTFRQLVRSGAQTILIDEIRDQDTAAEVLEASINGHLIVTTMLGENVIQTIAKLHALANHKLPVGSAQSLIADGLVGVLHQRMVRGVRPKLGAEFLFLKDAPVAKTILRGGRYEMLASEIKQQMVSMISGNAAAKRIAEV
jgi:Tfp pilus assembly pilus retraction ATPase PilT